MKSTEKSLIDANPEPYRMDMEFYDNIRAKASERTLLQRTIIPPNNGKRIPSKQGTNFQGDRRGGATSCRRMSLERRLSSAGIP